MMEDTVQQAC